MLENNKNKFFEICWIVIDWHFFACYTTGEIRRKAAKPFKNLKFDYLDTEVFDMYIYDNLCEMAENEALAVSPLAYVVLDLGK